MRGLRRQVRGKRALFLLGLLLPSASSAKDSALTHEVPDPRFGSPITGVQSISA